MMNKKTILMLCTLTFGFFIGVAYATVFSDTYDTATPAGSDDPAEADDRMREIKSAVQEREAVNHHWPLTGTEVSDADAGEHLNILFHAPIAATPTVAADHGDLRIKDVANGSDTLAELVFTNESEEELQLTSAGNNLANDTYLTGTDEAGTGSVNLIKPGRNEVDDADVAVISDAARTATDAAPTEDTGIVNKKYVDEKEGLAGGWVNFLGRTTNGACTINDSFNVTGVTRTATGRFTIIWDTNFSGADYPVVGNTRGNNAGEVVAVIPINPQAGSVTIATLKCSNNTDADLNGRAIHVVGFGQ